MSTISSDERTIEHSPGEKSALLRLSYHVISDQVSGFGSHEARMILHLLARYSRSLRESHPIEDGEGWVLVPREPTEAEVTAVASVMQQYKMPAGWQTASRIALKAARATSPSNPGTSKVENSRST